MGNYWQFPVSLLDHDSPSVTVTASKEPPRPYLPAAHSLREASAIEEGAGTFPISASTQLDVGQVLLMMMMTQHKLRRPALSFRRSYGNSKRAIDTTHRELA